MVSASLGILLEMHILRLHPSPAESDQDAPRDLCFNKSPGDLEVRDVLVWIFLRAARYTGMQERGEFKPIFL